MPLDPTQPFDLVSITDPNLDERMDITGYLSDLDPDLIKDKPNTKAIRFHFEPMSIAMLRFIDSQFKLDKPKFQAAFQACYRGRLQDGVEHNVSLQTLKVDGKPCHQSTQTDFEEFADLFSFDVIEELGAHLYRLRRGARKGSPFTGG
ncbi:MAG: hypothetical protein E6Q97_36625 [Desulfurellales bacterium]|nr:MAG: hypothetical protein E6Q97_36625 [Desulfurellales bacterium]